MLLLSKFDTLKAAPISITASSLLLLTLLLTSQVSAAEAPDYSELFRTKGLKCVHGTVNTDKAKVEITRPAEAAGDITTVRVKAYYEGLIKKNVMEAELMVRQSGSIRQMKIHVLSDTGTGLGSCALEKDWADF
jgi:hypothetical protein